MPSIGRLGFYLVITFIVYTLFKQPDSAASAVKMIASTAESGVASIGEFFDALL